METPRGDEIDEIHAEIQEIEAEIKSLRAEVKMRRKKAWQNPEIAGKAKQRKDLEESFNQEDWDIIFLGNKNAYTPNIESWYKLSEEILKLENEIDPELHEMELRIVELIKRRKELKSN